MIKTKKHHQVDIMDFKKLLKKYIDSNACHCGYSCYCNNDTIREIVVEEIESLIKLMIEIQEE